MRGKFAITPSQWNPVAVAAAILLAFAFLFGGASRLHELRLALVELAALPLLVLSVFALVRAGELRQHPLAFGVMAATAVLPLFQLIPLPPTVWPGLPGRSEAALALDLAGLPMGWIPLSLTPDRTWQSFLALLPPLAMFLAPLAVGRMLGRPLVQVMLGFTLASIALGAAQLASGDTALYLWPTTDRGSVVGLFANRNHLATLCLMAIPFAAVIGVAGLRRGAGRTHLWLATVFIAVVVVAVGVVRSRAGIVLLLPVLAATLLAAWVSSGRGRPRPLLLVIVGAMTAASVAVAVFSLDPILARFERVGSPEGRFENWPVVARAAEEFLPLGSGLGSFDTVYRSVEPVARLDATYFNQAHNEYLEIWLETGWVGVAALVAFLIWFARRSWSVWGARPSTTHDLQRAATVAIGAVLLHSAVDYPLRTETIAVLFALCCGLLEMGRRTRNGETEVEPQDASV